MTHNEFLEKKYFSNLDGIRCIAILGVLWHHSSGTNPFDSPIFGRGYLGVDLFFILSGFLITTLLVREFQLHGAINLKNFYIRRSLRIFPIYYGFLALYVVKASLFDRPHEQSEFFEALPFYLLYLSNWIPEDVGNPIHRLWSLAVEEQFYLVWPALLLIFRSRKILIVGAIFVLIVLLISFAPESGELHQVSRKLVPFQTILMGAILAIALQHQNSFNFLRSAIDHKAFIMVSAAFLLVFLLLFRGPLNGVSEFLVHCSMVTFIASAVLNERNLLSPLLRLYPVSLIGTISYGIYLFHGQFWGASNKIVTMLPIEYLANSRVTFFLVIVVISSVVSFLSYRFFELRFLNLKKKFTSPT